MLVHETVYQPLEKFIISFSALHLLLQHGLIGRHDSEYLQAYLTFDFMLVFYEGFLIALRRLALSL